MPNDPAVIEEMLGTATAIAVIGMSDKPHRASYSVGRYLAAQDYRVFPVNPALQQVLGMPCYADLDAAQAAAQQESGQAQSSGQAGKGIDLVDVFRGSEHVPAIAEDVIRLKIPYLWLQDGVVHDEAVARARAAGVKCVQNDCIYREHAKRNERS